jgi:DNA invertase Pin-like site-specific DNA recombinase
MTINEVLTYFEHRQSKVARALNVHKQTVWLWCKAKKIPYDKQCILEVMTKGELKANKDD